MSNIQTIKCLFGFHDWRDEQIGVCRTNHRSCSSGLVTRTSKNPAFIRSCNCCLKRIGVVKYQDEERKMNADWLLYQLENDGMANETKAH